MFAQESVRDVLARRPSAGCTERVKRETLAPIAGTRRVPPAVATKVATPLKLLILQPYGWHGDSIAPLRIFSGIARVYGENTGMRLSRSNASPQVSRILQLRDAI